MRVWEVWSAGHTKGQVVLASILFFHEENVKMHAFGNMSNEKHSGILVFGKLKIQKVD